MLRPQKTHTNSCSSKIPPPPLITFLMVRPLVLTRAIMTPREVLESAEHLACQGTLYFVLVKRTRHLKETRLFGYDFISRSIENLEVDLRGFAIDNYSFLVAFGFK